MIQQIIKFIRKILRIRNYCVMCQSRGIETAFKCEHGHITCVECTKAGVSKCFHHFCNDTVEWFEPQVQPAEKVRVIERIIERPIYVEIEKYVPPKLPDVNDWKRTPRFWTSTEAGTSNIDINWRPVFTSDINSTVYGAWHG